MTRGWFTEVPSWRGRDGTRIPEFGLAARTSRSEWATESVSSEVLAGAGLIGDSIGVAITQLLAAAGTTRGATRFITEAATTEAGARAAEFPTAAALTEAGAQAAEFPTAAASTEVGAQAADFPAVPAQRPELSTETGRRREATLHPAARKVSARAPSAASRRAGRQRAIRHGERPASAGEQRVAAVAEKRAVAVVEQRAAAGAEERVVAAGVVGTINQRFVMFLMLCCAH